MKKKELQNREEIQSKISEHYKQIMELLGLDLKDPSLKGTPDRVAKMYLEDLCKGLYEDTPRIAIFPNDGKYDQMLVERNITMHSVCEHHFVPIVGKVHVAYIPDKNVIGLSKLIRIVQHVSARPQLQERLTQDIANTLKKVLETENVAVVVEAVHFCCNIRGAKDPNASTVTSYLGGDFRTPEVRKELYDNIKL